jgi:hypothetical protein
VHPLPARETLQRGEPDGAPEPNQAPGIESSFE